MKRTDLLKRLAQGADEQGVTFEFVREGHAHTVFRFDGRNVIVPRHREIAEGTARGILRAAFQKGAGA